MVRTAKTVLIKASIEHTFDVFKDFKNYPDFQPDVDEVIVHSCTKTKARVTFAVNIVQRVEYTLDFTFRRPHEIKWKMISGSSLMKENTGSWIFTELEKKLTEVIFDAEVKFAFWIPASIADGIVKTHLPKMLRYMKKQAEKKL